MAVAANCGITLHGSEAKETYRTGRYPNFEDEGLPELAPWHRRQFSY